MSRPSISTEPERGHQHAHDGLRRRRLAAARLAHERDELAGGDRQRDAVDGAHDALLAARERADEAARQRVVHDEVAHLQERRGAHAADPARWQAAW